MHTYFQIYISTLFNRKNALIQNINLKKNGNHEDKIQFLTTRNFTKMFRDSAHKY